MELDSSAPIPNAHCKFNGTPNSQAAAELYDRVATAVETNRMPSSDTQRRISGSYAAMVMVAYASVNFLSSVVISTLPTNADEDGRQ